MLKSKKTKKTKPKFQTKKYRKSSSLKYLKCLKPGDLIEIIAPGSATSLENLKSGVDVLQSWGYQVVYDESLLEPSIFLSNTDKKRFASFRKAMTNKKSKAVWCLRGGYGSIRLLPWIEKMKIPKNKKILIGLSDISSLHAVLNQRWKFSTLHAPLLDRLGAHILPADNICELRKTLEDPEYVTEFSNLVPLNKAAIAQKKIKSQVIGGNLMVVTSTLGTISQLKTKNKILFLEELCERAYRVDRCLQQMKQAGLFNNVSAVVFGDFINCDEPNKENHIQIILRDFFKDLKIPAYTGIETGHGEKQRPLFFNTEAHLICGKNAKMLVYSAFKKEQGP